MLTWKKKEKKKSKSGVRLWNADVSSTWQLLRDDSTRNRLIRSNRSLTNILSPKPNLQFVFPAVITTFVLFSFFFLLLSKSLASFSPAFLVRLFVLGMNQNFFFFFLNFSVGFLLNHIEIRLGCFDSYLLIFRFLSRFRFLIRWKRQRHV